MVIVLLLLCKPWLSLEVLNNIFYIKGAKYKIQNASTSRETLFRWSFGRCFAFFTLYDQLVAQHKNICFSLKKAVTKNKARVNFEQQILALFLVFHQTRNLSCIHTKQINYTAGCIFFSIRNNCFCFATSLWHEVKNAKHRPKTCNETMLHGMLRAFVSGISPP